MEVNSTIVLSRLSYRKQGLRNWMVGCAKSLISPRTCIALYSNIGIVNQKFDVSSKVKAFAWLMAHKRVNTNDMLQLKRPYKAVCPNWCILCMESEETVDHL